MCTSTSESTKNSLRPSGVHASPADPSCCYLPVARRRDIATLLGIAVVCGHYSRTRMRPSTRSRLDADNGARPACVATIKQATQPDGFSRRTPGKPCEAT